MKCICSNQEIYLRRVRFVLRQVNLAQWSRSMNETAYFEELQQSDDRFRLLYKKATKDKSYLRSWLQDNRLCIWSKATPSSFTNMILILPETWRDVSQFGLSNHNCVHVSICGISLFVRDCLLPESHFWSHLSHLKKLKRRRRLIRFPGCGCAQALGETERAPPSARTQPSQRRARSTGIQSII